MTPLRKIFSARAPTSVELGEKLLQEIERGAPSLTKVKDLIQQGADLNIKDQTGNTPLERAFNRRLLGVAEELLKNGASVQATRNNGTELFLNALRYGAPYAAVAERLLDAGADISGRDYQGNNTLVLAVEQRNLALVEKLLEKGISVHDAGERGWTALHLACWCGEPQIAQLLISYGADVNAMDAGGSNHVVASAIYYGYGDTQGAAPLIYAVEKGHLELARLLLNHGAALNQRSKQGYTPLMWAAYLGHEDLVRLLIERGADDSLANKGDTALSFAQQRQHQNIADFLQSVKTKKEQDALVKKQTTLQKDITVTKHVTIKPKK